MSADNNMENPDILKRVILAIMVLSLVGMFAGSFVYRHSNPSLVKHLSPASERGFGAAESEAPAQAMQHIAELMSQLKDTPDSYDLRLELAEHFMEVSQWSSAAVHLEKAAEISPGSLPVYMYLGYCRFNLQEYETAARHYAKAVELSGDANAKVNLAYIYKNHLNRKVEAEALFDAVINSDAGEEVRAVARDLKAAS